MYQIDNSTAAQAIPASTAAGSKGYFTDGNPATGTPATILPAEFMNMLMMENLNVLTAGGVLPDKTKFNQLALAISNIVATGMDSKVAGDAVSVVGLSSGDITKPYIARKADSKICLLQPLLGYTPVQQGGVSTVKFTWGVTGLKLTVDTSELGTVWLSSNFDPNAKANWGNKLVDYRIGDAYTKDEVGYLLSGKTSGDDVIVAGFASGDVTKPYFRRASDGKVYVLQPALGFTPVQQGGGVGQLSNALKIGWSASGLKATVDGTDLGNLWYSSNFNPNLKADAETTATKTELSNGLAAKQANLGFVPIQQGGGVGQTTNKINIGWSTTALKVSIDGNDLGNILLSSDCDLTGTVVHFAMAGVPAGFLKANGAAVSRTTYARLFSKINTFYGAGDGSSTFNLPDARGEFLRSWDDGRGVDFNRVFGSVQLGAIEAHSHAMSAGNDWTYNNVATANTKPFKDGASSYPTGITGGSETRPRNLALLACIKY